MAQSSLFSLQPVTSGQVLAQVGGEGAPPTVAPTTNQAPGGPDTSSTTSAPGGPDGTVATERPPGLFEGPFFLMMMAILGVFLMMSIFGGRKEKKKREDMLNSLTKGDEVETVGGEIGTVVSVKGDEVLLKVDENANTKIRYRRSAIQLVRGSKPKNGNGNGNGNGHADAEAEAGEDD